MGKGKVLAKTWFVHKAINCLHQRASSLSLNTIQTTILPRYTCNQLLPNHPLNPTTLAPPGSSTSPQTLTIASPHPPRYETPKSRTRHTHTTRGSRNSTAPSSIKPRQLVRHLLFSLHYSSLSISATPPPLSTSSPKLERRQRKQLTIDEQSHLHAQLASLSANLADLENLLRMTSVQAESVRGLGAWHGGLYVRFSYPLLPIPFAYDFGFLDPWLGMVGMRRRRRRTFIDRTEDGIGTY